MDDFLSINHFVCSALVSVAVLHHNTEQDFTQAFVGLLFYKIYVQCNQ